MLGMINEADHEDKLAGAHTSTRLPEGGAMTVNSLRRDHPVAVGPLSSAEAGVS